MSDINIGVYLIVSMSRSAPNKEFKVRKLTSCLPYVKVHDRPFLIMEDEAMEEFQQLDQTNPNAVVIGLAPSKFNYQKVTHKLHVSLS